MLDRLRSVYSQPAASPDPVITRAAAQRVAVRLVLLGCRPLSAEEISEKSVSSVTRLAGGARRATAQLIAQAIREELNRPSM